MAPLQNQTSADPLRSASPSSPPQDLRHMTSNTHLTSPSKDTHHGRSRSPNRLSQHLKASDVRLATSVPGSPTSIHSSSSAIFERDIEPILLPSPHTHSSTHPPNPHRIPRAKTTEQLEQAVPSVLDSAASALATMENEPVAVISPISNAGVSSLELGLGLAFANQGGMGGGVRGGRASGFSSPAGDHRSRSPSPLGNRINEHGSAQVKGELLLGIPIPNAPQTQAPPAIVTPTSGGLDGPMKPTQTASSPSSPPHPLPSNISPPTTHPTSPTSPVSPTPNPILLPTTSHPPSPRKPSQTQNAKANRLSFISYSDLLSSTPTSTQPLSSLTTSASISVEPPHLASVSGGLSALSVAGSRVGSKPPSRVGSVTGSPVSSPISLPLSLSSLPSVSSPTMNTINTNVPLTTNHASPVGGPIGGLSHPGWKLPERRMRGDERGGREAW
ncbi:hypothetical protein BJ165DRAFT_933259 [Panaeolus papilionaceus]|nr:hypothetical protein BJ165DRAFT_933259 [Panaeolus papilionaceus]